MILENQVCKCVYKDCQETISSGLSELFYEKENKALTEEQKRECDEIIHAAQLTAISVGGNTVSFLCGDKLLRTTTTLKVGPIHLAMITALAQVFHQKMEDEQARAIIDDLMNSNEVLKELLKNAATVEQLEELGWSAVKKIEAQDY